MTCLATICVAAWSAGACAAAPRDPGPAARPAQRCPSSQYQVQVRNDGRTDADVYYYEAPASTPRFLRTVSAGNTMQVALPTGVTNVFATLEGSPERRVRRGARVQLNVTCARV